jgi:hypothetical protein
VVCRQALDPVDTNSSSLFLPVAAIITPATITVVAQQKIQTSIRTPPQLFFDPTQYANVQTRVLHNYMGPSFETLRTAFGSAMTNKILSVPVFNPNTSYTLEFLGPAVMCDLANASIIDQIHETYLR